MFDEFNVKAASRSREQRPKSDAFWLQQTLRYSVGKLLKCFLWCHYLLFSVWKIIFVASLSLSLSHLHCLIISLLHFTEWLSIKGDILVIQVPYCGTLLFVVFVVFALRSIGAEITIFASYITDFICMFFNVTPQLGKGPCRCVFLYLSEVVSLRGLIPGVAKRREFR